MSLWVTVVAVSVTRAGRAYYRNATVKPLLCVVLLLTLSLLSAHCCYCVVLPPTLRPLSTSADPDES